MKDIIREFEPMIKTFIIIILIILMYKAINLAANAEEKDILVSKSESFVIDAVKMQEEKKTILKSKKEELPREMVKDNKTIEPFIISGLDPEGINEKLKGTYLENTGQVLYEIEQEKSVNFRFIYAIGALESGYGKYLPAPYNYFGLTKGGQYRGYQSFNSKEEVLRYMGRLLTSKTYYKKDIEEIAKIYCPPNHFKWSRDVKYIMGEI